jgi:hypothetical protein
VVVQPARPVVGVVQKSPPLVQGHSRAVGDVAKKPALGRDVDLKVQPENRFVDEYTIVILNALEEVKLETQTQNRGRRLLTSLSAMVTVHSTRSGVRKSSNVGARK